VNIFNVSCTEELSPPCQEKRLPTTRRSCNQERRWWAGCSDVIIQSFKQLQWTFTNITVY